MEGLLLGISLQRLHLGRVIEDHAELGLIALELIGSQVKAGKTRHVGNINVDWHGRRSVGNSPTCAHRHLSVCSYVGWGHIAAHAYSDDVAGPSPLRSTALTLGVVGLIAAVAGMLIVFTGTDDLNSPTAGVLIRVGAILLAVSLVLPVVKKPSTVMTVVVGAGLLVVLLRPGLIWAALIAWVLWLGLGRQRSTDDNAS